MRVIKFDQHLVSYCWEKGKLTLYFGKLGINISYLNIWIRLRTQEWLKEYVSEKLSEFFTCVIIYVSVQVLKI